LENFKMTEMRNFRWLPVILILATACSNHDKSDAYGNFEATSVLISAEGTGQLMAFDVEEGEHLGKDQLMGWIDTTALHLKKKTLEAQARILPEKTREAGPEIAVLTDQRDNLIRERDRTLELLKQKAATQKQLDDYNGEIAVINQQIQKIQREIQIANRGVLAENEPIRAEIDLLNEQITKSIIINPLEGTVLTKLAEPHELVGPGSPLYKIASLDTMKLKAYTSATLLQKTALNDPVTVLIDDGEDDYRKLEGRVSRIASEAEFTPKTIETKEERVNLVYAIDVLVPNDGSLRIGMPGEVVFRPLNQTN